MHQGKDAALGSGRKEAWRGPKRRFMDGVKEDMKLLREKWMQSTG